NERVLRRQLNGGASPAADLFDRLAGFVLRILKRVAFIPLWNAVDIGQRHFEMVGATGFYDVDGDAAPLGFADALWALAVIVLEREYDVGLVQIVDHVYGQTQTARYLLQACLADAVRIGPQHARPLR